MFFARIGCKPKYANLGSESLVNIRLIFVWTENLLTIMTCKHEKQSWFHYLMVTIYALRPFYHHLLSCLQYGWCYESKTRGPSKFLKIGGIAGCLFLPARSPNISSLSAQDQISFAQQELAKTQKTQVRWMFDEGNSYPSWFHGKSGQKSMIWGYRLVN